MNLSFDLIPHPCESLGTPEHPSPLNRSHHPGSPGCRFVRDDDWVLYCNELHAGVIPAGLNLVFEKAGPREQLFFAPPKITAAIVTCGGLCPGLNDVIRALYNELFHNYGVRSVLGIRHGFHGLNASCGERPYHLTAEFVEDIHLQGGTVLGTSRGEQPMEKVVEFLMHRGIDMLFCVGGDGTLRGAAAIARACAEHGLVKSIIGIPKTIDNDVAYCDRTFGTVTAIEKAHEVIIQAHTEAKAAQRGIGLVKVMGREAGFIACGAALASQEANFVLIPEVTLELEGERGFLARLRKRMAMREHAVIIAAEGAGQQLLATGPVECDKSGNRKLQDIGLYLKQRIADYFRDVKEPVDIKYIDPSYLVRSVPADSDDRILCDQLARHAVHAAMAGKTNVLVCYKNHNFMHVPIPLAVAKKQRVDVNGELWASVLAATGQPSAWS